MAIDECENCTIRGDYLKCSNTYCTKHNTWYVKELKRLYENAITEQGMILETIGYILEGNKPTDFQLSYPTIRQIYELVSQKLPNVPDGTPHHPQGEHNGNDEFAD